MTRVRRLSAWLLVVPLMLAGTESAHALAYRIVYPEASVRWHVLAETGHGYFGWTPVFLGVGLALSLVGLASSVVDTVRRRPPRSVPPWAFGLLPLAGFTSQEFVERWLATGAMPWWMVEQPTFRIGLLLQLPFALLAYSVARLLLRAARRVGIILAGAPASIVSFGQSSAWQPFELSLPRLAAIAGGRAVRGPPLPGPAASPRLLTFV